MNRDLSFYEFDLHGKRVTVTGIAIRSDWSVGLGPDFDMQSLCVDGVELLDLLEPEDSLYRHALDRVMENAK